MSKSEYVSNSQLLLQYLLALESIARERTIATLPVTGRHAEADFPCAAVPIFVLDTAARQVPLAS
jgi:hypothetical protein